MRKVGRPTVVIATAFAVVLVAGAALVFGQTTPAALSWTALRNATYPTSVDPRGVILKDGLFEREAAPGSASKVIVRLADVAAFGTLDADATIDAAVVLTSSGGGSGTFVEVAAVRNASGIAQPVASVLLGDRVLVREVRVEDHQIVVRLRARDATDPFTQLTHEITRRYALDGDRLTLIAESEADVRDAPADTFVYRPQRIDLAVGASTTLRATLPPGGIGAYTIHATAKDVLALEVRSEFDNAVLSVQGLADGITLVSRSEYATRRTLTLPSDQDYSVKVVTLAGYALPLSLDVARRAPAPQAVASATATSAPLPSQTPASPQRTPAPGLAERALGDASSVALAFGRTRPPIWGAAVYVPSRGVVYTENADTQVPTASIVKALVLLVVLEQARQEKRAVTDDELALLWPMITESDNDATSQLWEHIGRGQAVSSYLRSVGVNGFTPDPGTSWGVSFVSARAMATMLGKLIGGDILDAPSRDLAIRMLEGVVDEQHWGITAGITSESGDQVGVKNGWYPGDEGWRVNSVGIVRPHAGAPYAIAVVTGGRVSLAEGISTIEGIAAPLNAAMRNAQ